jgi:hypothetical protein
MCMCGYDGIGAQRHIMMMMTMMMMMMMVISDGDDGGVPKMRGGRAVVGASRLIICHFLMLFIIECEYCRLSN